MTNMVKVTIAVIILSLMMIDLSSCFGDHQCYIVSTEPLFQLQASKMDLAQDLASRQLPGITETETVWGHCGQFITHQQNYPLVN